MRIALAHSHPETFGGGERALLELARGLSARHDVHLLLGRYQPDHTYPELAERPRTSMLGPRWLLAMPDADVVVANSFGANLLALRSGPKTLYWVHSVRGRFLQPGAIAPSLLARRALDWLAVRRDARLVANSAFTAARIRQLYGRTADAVVYPGVDLDFFLPRSQPGTYALSVGRIAPEKGLDRLVRLWHGLTDLPLHVIGEGDPDYVQRLRTLAPSNVHFRGAMDRAALVAAYQGARVAVFTPHAEELGIAPLEAMACGVPVVAWREGGLVETIVDGETGYLVEDAEAFRLHVLGVARDPALRAALGRAARARAEQFTWSRAVDTFERLCAEVAGLDAASPRSPTR